MILKIDLFDELDPYFQQILKDNKKVVRTVAKSLGYFVRKETIKGIRSGAPAGEEFAERLPYKARRALSPTAKRMWYGALRSAVAYEYSMGTVRIGWITDSAARVARKQEEGFKRSVTGQMRRFWAHAVERSKGNLTNLSAKKTEIVDPARPVFEPMSEYLKPKYKPYVEQKLTKYVDDWIVVAKKNPVRKSREVNI